MDISTSPKHDDVVICTSSDSSSRVDPELRSAFHFYGKPGRSGGAVEIFSGKKEYLQSYSSFPVFTEMFGILLNHLPHHTYVPCSLVSKRFISQNYQWKEPFHLIPQRNNFFHTNGKRSTSVLFHLTENSHWFFHTAK